MLYPGAQGCMNLSLTRLFLWGMRYWSMRYLRRRARPCVPCTASCSGCRSPKNAPPFWNHAHVSAIRNGTSTWDLPLFQKHGLGWALQERWMMDVSVAVVAEVDVAAYIGPRVGGLASAVPAVVSSFVTCSPSASRIPSPFLAGKIFFF